MRSEPGESAQSFAHRFRREIDYGSAACLLIERETFWAVDGFDPVYGVGYFEDVDLCFKLKERGLRTMYEPRSKVVHERHGSGTSAQARKRMEANRAIFYRRWSERLSRRPNLVELPTNPPRLISARDAEVVDRILVLDDRVPFHDRGSGDPRMAKMLDELVELWPVGSDHPRGRGRLRGGALRGAVAGARDRSRRASGRLAGVVRAPDLPLLRRDRQPGPERGTVRRPAEDDPATGFARFRHGGAHVPPARADGRLSRRLGGDRASPGRGDRHAPGRARGAAPVGGHLRGLGRRGRVHRRGRDRQADVRPPELGRDGCEAGRLPGATATCSSSAASSPARDLRTRMPSCTSWTT